MKSKLNSILLIDDDEATNFIHSIIIKKAGVSEKVITIQNGKEALEYLQSKEENGKYPQPDLILLDINMPIMNGWEFMDHYIKLPKEQQGKIIIVMLTTSINPNDKKKAMSLSSLDGYKTKPLTRDMLEELYQDFFGNKLPS